MYLYGEKRPTPHLHLENEGLPCGFPIEKTRTCRRELRQWEHSTVRGQTSSIERLPLAGGS